MDRGQFPHLIYAQVESARKVTDIFGGDALLSLAAATPAEQFERIEVFDTYERWIIAHVQGLQAPVTELNDSVSFSPCPTWEVGRRHLEALPEMPSLLNLEELSMKDFLAELKAGEIAEMVLLKPETSPEDLNSSSVMDEDILEGLTKQWATRLGIEILKNTEDPVCPLVKEFFDVTWIPHKDGLLNNLSGCTMYNALDLVDGYYQILMRESDIPLTATYFDDIFVHSRAEDGQMAMEVHLKHLRRVFDVMKTNKLYANIDKRVFAAEEITILGCFVNRVDVRADPGKVKAIAAWPTPRSQKDLRTWGLANYLHKYSAGYAELARPLSDLLKKDADWVWERQQQDAFDSIKASLQQAPVLALPDENKSFSVVCDASDYAIGCALL
ncbi:Retrotransposon Polyprotein [Phytophthora palmivora]|uniref:Retrotransposon Polyprotein n=1 Tax=Phytophthora palmivora TaxID=4796 RepID=A0A2P4YMV6_9STRA|nr:Retrotransposon Polyprotein [Phytophthora palmivora]